MGFLKKLAVETTGYLRAIKNLNEINSIEMN